MPKDNYRTSGFSIGLSEFLPDPLTVMEFLPGRDTTGNTGAVLPGKQGPPEHATDSSSPHSIRSYLTHIEMEGMEGMVRYAQAIPRATEVSLLILNLQGRRM